MRSFLAGLIFLVTLSSGVLAQTPQVTGRVESIGIKETIRPDCWTPLRVSLSSNAAAPLACQLQIWQVDLDKDHVVYTKDITLNPNSPNQKFEAYFVMQPLISGKEKTVLPEQLTAPVLQSFLRVSLCLAPDKDKKKKPDELVSLIDRLPISLNARASNTDPNNSGRIDNIDPAEAGRQAPRRRNDKSGCRLVLYVTDDSSTLKFDDYGSAAGLVESPMMLPVHPSDLGENVLYYDAVDTVIWLSGKTGDLSAAGSHQLDALQQFVRQGGKLVVCQSTDLQKTEDLAPMLPVELREENRAPLGSEDMGRFMDTGESRDANPLAVDALPWMAHDLGRPHANKYFSHWNRIINANGQKPLRLVRAKPKAGAVVELWQYYSVDQFPYWTQERVPYLLQGPYNFLRNASSERLPLFRWPSHLSAQEYADILATSKGVPRFRWPYLVRGSYGLGCVTWVAQDLGDRNLLGDTKRVPPDSDNWPHIWDKVIGWQNDTATAADAGSGKDPDPSETQDQRNKALARNITVQEEHRATKEVVDLSKWMNQGTNGSKGTQFIFVAVVFFILYWLGSGPITYLVLKKKKRKELNWFLYGAWAFVGTILTLVVVRLLLHGPPEAHHLTVVRQVAGEPAYIYSRVGLYIARDGDQAIGLDQTATDEISFITPLQLHSEYADTTDFPAAQQYGIPVHNDPQPVSLQIPFRTTAKKLQMRWVGALPTGIGGTAQLIESNNDSGVITGTLINQTGNDLKNVYFAFAYTGRGEKHSDMVLYVPKWDNGAQLKLNDAYDSAKGIVLYKVGDPLNANSWKGPIQGQWDSSCWRAVWGKKGMNTTDTRAETDFAADAPTAFPVLSLYDLIRPAENEEARVDFIRRGGRILNMSSAVAAGKLVILAQSTSDDRPLPFPLMVEGSRVGGEGRVLYQFALPLDRTEMEKDALKQ